MNIVNDAKLRTKQEKTNIKNQMIADMEEFSKELQAAKQNISSTQDVIIGTIRDKMEASFAAWESSLRLGQSTTNGLYSPAFKRYTGSAISPSQTSSSIRKQDSQISFDSKLSAHDNDINYLLGATGAVSMEALITELQQSEEYIFRSVNPSLFSLLLTSLISCSVSTKIFRTPLSNWRSWSWIISNLRLMSTRRYTCLVHASSRSFSSHSGLLSLDQDSPRS
jgi:hypothetical protein